jgi:uncharacterized protein (TIGR03663 family)
MMLRRIHFFRIIFSVVFAGAAVFRLEALSHRPMHADEAVQGFRSGALLEQHILKYDPGEYHGPTLAWSTLIPALLRGEKTLDRIQETTLRIVPVCFGLGMLLLLLLLTEGMGREWVLAAEIWTAFSAPLVYYSRTYIHESLLIFFSFGAIACGYRYWKASTWTWAAVFGTFIGWMHATKETCVLIWAAALAALACNLLYSIFNQGPKSISDKNTRFGHVLIAAAAAACVSILLYSSFFRYSDGIADSLRSFFIYIKRSSARTAHEHPWNYYLRMMVFWHVPGKPVWTELPVVLLACIGGIHAFRRQKKTNRDVGLSRFLVFYTIILCFLYSILPYKTPWCALGFYHGLVLLAATGTIVLWRGRKSIYSKASAGILTVLVFAVSLRNSIFINERYDSDPSNPWAYASTSPDVGRIYAAVERVIRFSTDPEKIRIHIIVAKHEYWPLPWYFRRLKNVGWFDQIDDKSQAAEMILVSAGMENELAQKQFDSSQPGQKHLYVPLWRERLELRPGVEILGYIRKDVWDGLQETSGDPDSMHGFRI